MEWTLMPCIGIYTTHGNLFHSTNIHTLTQIHLWNSLNELAQRISASKQLQTQKHWNWTNILCMINHLVYPKKVFGSLAFMWVFTAEIRMIWVAFECKRKSLKFTGSTFLIWSISFLEFTVYIYIFENTKSTFCLVWI